MLTLRQRGKSSARWRWPPWSRGTRELENGPRGDAENLEAQLQRRRAAALRLPPLECGCRDPLHPDHWAGLCRSAPRRQP